MNHVAQRETRNFIAIFIALLIIFEAIAYVSMTPQPQEPLFQLYVLGTNHMVSDYYPGNNSLIRPGAIIRWYVGVTNLMGNVQFVEVRIKLGNWTIAPPDDFKAQPSPAPLVVAFQRFTQNNETWEIPFDWEIINATTNGGSVCILELGINNETYSFEDACALYGYMFRWIFELWVWNAQYDGLQFGWFAGSEHRVAWLQVWFNATTTSQDP